MSNEPPPDEQSELDVERFLDWLDDMAASTGQSREELLETLATSYWTVNEVSRLVEDAERDPAGDDRSDDAARAPDTPAAIAARLDDIEDRVESLADADAGGTAPADLVAELDAIRERLASLEVRLGESQDESPTDRDLEAVSARQQALDDRHEALSDRVDTEFGHLRTILEHLVETTGDLESFADHYDRAVGPLLADRHRTVELKRTAARLGIFEADCGHCDSAVDLALLPTPRCPHCDRSFVDVEPKQGWFGSPTLVVGDGPRGTESGAFDNGADGGTARAGKRSAPDRDSSGFEWVGSGE